METEKKKRNKEIYKAVRDEGKVSAIAKTYNISRERVRQIFLKEQRKPFLKLQTDLVRLLREQWDDEVKDALEGLWDLEPSLIGGDDGKLYVIYWFNGEMRDIEVKLDTVEMEHDQSTVRYNERTAQALENLSKELRIRNKLFLTRIGKRK